MKKRDNGLTIKNCENKTTALKQTGLERLK
jgi:hypothetical protein